MKITLNKSNPPLGGLLAAELYKFKANKIEFTWGDESKVTPSNESKTIPYGNNIDLMRILWRTFEAERDPLIKTKINSWLTFSLSLEDEIPASLACLDKDLTALTYLVGETLSIADLSVYSVLYVSPKYKSLSKGGAYKNVARWMKLISTQPSVQSAMKGLPNNVRENLEKASNAKSRRSPPVASNVESKQEIKQEGKFIELPYAEMGKVIVRFPPEASGYLHIGHAKAALLNQYYQEAFNGKLIMRFDDTNPAKENVHFEKVILEDVELLEIKPDMFTHTSQYFDIMLNMCEKLLREGKAYIDDTEPELMKQQRENREESVNRNNSLEKNLQLWEEMKKGSAIGIKCCARAKIDMQSTNGCMRDPTIYRCKPEPHPRTASLYKVYPTYDFACPIVDSIEGVTHVLRTMEYHDRDPQFYWFIEALGLRKPYIWEYSRLSMTNTVLSKRKLTWFVEQGLVDGWDDPRMPTVRGVLRRGMTVEGLRQFIRAQGSSRSVVFMEWDKIWAINKKVIDPVAPRYTALESEPVPVTLKGVNSVTTLNVALHPKNPSVGSKEVSVGPKLLIDQVDAQTLKVNENVTFINYGNVMIDMINRSPDGKVTSIIGTPNLENKDYKKTLKITWLCDSEQYPLTLTYCVYFDHIISKPLLGKDEDFKQYIDHNTRTEVAMLGETALSTVKEGDIIQLQRRGFFRVDVAPGPRSPHTGRIQPAILFHIPDGSMKDQSGLTKKQLVKAEVTTPSTEKKQKSDAQSSGGGGSDLIGELNARDLIGELNARDLIGELNARITEQGNKIRTLKESKADKSLIQPEVQTLLSLKAEFKKASGSDWQPNMSLPTVSVNVDTSPISSDNINKIKEEIDRQEKILGELRNKYNKLVGQSGKPQSSNGSGDAGQELAAKITEQGNLVRDLKAKKSDKSTIDVEVKKLLQLKSDYQNVTGVAYTPQASNTNTAVKKDMKKAKEQVSISSINPGQELAAKITEQGNLVRDLKAKKSDKSTIDVEVKKLLQLKSDYQNVTGVAYTPQASNTNIAVKDDKKKGKENTEPTPVSNDIENKIAAQGNIVRDLKSKKADKATIDTEVKKLLELKAEYQNVTGKAYTPPSQPAQKKEKTPAPGGNTEKKPKPEQKPKEDSGSGVKKITRLGLEASKDSDLPEWYSQVITKGEMIEYYDISGCYILRPWSFAIWEIIRDFLNVEFKKLGVKDCYFPIFVSKGALEREKDHIADFAPEVAWVTHSGSSELAEHIAVRPTSETVMYPAYAKWIQSHRDLPLRLNQWNNVVRWEFKQPQPFIRTREFLWQEGHTAFLTKDEADTEVLQILDLYARVYEEYLAIPVVKGRKSEKEKFAGGDYTTTVEAYVPASGRGIQGATSHHLGQNFSKMFDIIYDDPETQEKKYVYQNSWGITTRTIGVMILVHGDDRGLVLPPRVASIQVIVVPCGIGVATSTEDRNKLMSCCNTFVGALTKAGIRCEADYRDNYSPGWKFNHWELKGVPIRVEIGPKDMANEELVAVMRFNSEKITMKTKTAVTDIKKLLDETHKKMLEKATKERDCRLTITTSWNEFTTALEKKHILMAPFCGEIPCEDNIKNDSARLDDDNTTEVKAPAMGAKSLCIPFKQPKDIQSKDKCIHPKCNNKPKFYTLFGRSY